MEIKRLNVEHYDELINLLNVVFSRKNKREMNFEKEMPKMCIRDDEHMKKHFGVFEDNKLVACIGVYPFEAVVAGEKLQFATMGNIAVHWECEGKGYMSALIEKALSELDRLNVDIARLGGLRSRYNRYGYEACGQNYSFVFTEKNRQRKFPNFKGNISFRQIAEDDEEALTFSASLYNKNAIAVPRTPENAYLSLTMWLNTPYLAIRGNEPIGYLCANSDKTIIAEFDAVDVSSLTEMICAWQECVGNNISFCRQAYQRDSVGIFSAVCENYGIYSPSHFQIRKWEKVVDAFFKLKASYCPVIKGNLKIEIEEYGTIRIFSENGNVGCELCDDMPDIKLDKLTAARYIFGPYSPIYAADAPPIAQAWFPLPLSWNTQDRV